MTTDRITQAVQDLRLACEASDEQFSHRSLVAMACASDTSSATCPCPLVTDALNELSAALADGVMGRGAPVEEQGLALEEFSVNIEHQAKYDKAMAEISVARSPAVLRGHIYEAEKALAKLGVKGLGKRISAGASMGATVGGGAGAVASVLSPSPGGIIAPVVGAAAGGVAGGFAGALWHAMKAPQARAHKRELLKIRAAATKKMQDLGHIRKTSGFDVD